AVGIVIVAVAGLGYTTVALVGLARASVTDVADRFGYGILPLAAYLAMLAAAGPGYFAGRTRRLCFGRSRIASSCDKHPQCLGLDARFCAPNRKQKVGYPSDADTSCASANHAWSAWPNQDIHAVTRRVLTHSSRRSASASVG